MKLIIKDDDDRTTVVPLIRDEYTIGRKEGNTIRLTERNISRSHARLARDNGQIFIQDLGSYNGVKVNGERITSRAQLQDGDEVVIGDYVLEVEGTAAQEDTPTATPAPFAQPPGDKTPPNPVPAVRTGTPPAAQRKTPDGATAMIRIADLQRPSAPEEVRDVPPADQARIVAIAGPLRGNEFFLRRSVVKFGRSEDEGNDIIVDHVSISRQHGRFQFEGGGWRIYDHKSANGLRINGDEYGMSPVRPGDTIELGHVRFRFLDASEPFALPGDGATVPSYQMPRPENDEVTTHVKPAKKTALIAGLVVGVLVLVGAGALLLGGRGDAEKASPGKDLCGTAAAALAADDWESAQGALEEAKKAGSTCPYPIDDKIELARRNLEAKGAVARAQSQLDANAPARALDLLKGVSPGSAYDAKVRSLTTTAKEEVARQLSTEASKRLDEGNVVDARDAIDRLAAVAPQSESLAGLTQRLEKLRAPAPEPKKAAASASPAAAAPKKPAAPAQVPAAPTKAPPSPDKNAQAEQLLSEANDAIRSGDFLGGIGKLQKVVSLAPDKSYVCRAYRNMGVGYVRAGKTDEAVKNYRLFLKCDPTTPEREKLQQMIDSYDAQQR